MGYNTNMMNVGVSENGIPQMAILIEGSLEVKLPTIWTVEKQR